MTINDGYWYNLAMQERKPIVLNGQNGRTTVGDIKKMLKHPDIRARGLILFLGLSRQRITRILLKTDTDVINIPYEYWDVLEQYSNLIALNKRIHDPEVQGRFFQYERLRERRIAQKT